jgi:hypothetical protein
LRTAHRLAAMQPEPCTRLRAHGPDYIVAEADGTMVPIVDTGGVPNGADRRRHRRVRWQEARVVAARAHGTLRTHYDATLGDVHEAGARWSRVVGRAGWALNTRIHAVGDGAAWLAEQAAQRFGAHGAYLPDLHHGCDYFSAI